MGCLHKGIRTLGLVVVAGAVGGYSIEWSCDKACSAQVYMMMRVAGYDTGRPYDVIGPSPREERKEGEIQRNRGAERARLQLCLACCYIANSSTLIDNHSAEHLLPFNANHHPSIAKPAQSSSHTSSTGVDV